MKNFKKLAVATMFLSVFAAPVMADNNENGKTDFTPEDIQMFKDYLKLKPEFTNPAPWVFQKYNDTNLLCYGGVTEDVAQVSKIVPFNEKINGERIDVKKAITFGASLCVVNIFLGQPQVLRDYADYKVQEALNVFDSPKEYQELRMDMLAVYTVQLKLVGERLKKLEAEGDKMDAEKYKQQSHLRDYFDLELGQWQTDYTSSIDVNSPIRIINRRNELKRKAKSKK